MGQTTTQVSKHYNNVTVILWLLLVVLSKRPESYDIKFRYFIAKNNACHYLLLYFSRDKPQEAMRRTLFRTVASLVEKK